MAYPQYRGQKNKVRNTGVTIYCGDGTDMRPVAGDGTGNLILGASTARVGTVSGVLKEVRTAVVIDSSEGAFAAGDIVGNEDCCTTDATYWTFSGVARANGTHGYIVSAILISETENQAVQYDLFLFNATPTGTLLGGAANTNPVKGDRSKYLGVIEFPQSTAKGSLVATYSQATPSTVGGLPLAFKCAPGVADIYGVLVTNTVYTHDTGDDIEITLLIEQY